MTQPIFQFLDNPPSRPLIYPALVLLTSAEEIHQVLLDAFVSPCSNEFTCPLLLRVADIMFSIMYANRGIGLAAPQVRLPLRMFVINQTCDPKAKDHEYVFINPTITEKSPRTTLEMEACLSLPGIGGVVERPKMIHTEFINRDLKKQTASYAGLFARIWQHELDHLNGILFTDRLADDDKRRVAPLLVKLAGNQLAEKSNNLATSENWKEFLANLTEPIKTTQQLDDQWNVFVQLIKAEADKMKEGELAAILTANEKIYREIRKAIEETI